MMMLLLLLCILYPSQVLISVGCTGMLVTPEHVLTAAHCVHTDGRFKAGYSSLEVAVEMQYGLEWRRVNTIFLPSNWTNPGAASAVNSQTAFLLITLHCR